MSSRLARVVSREDGWEGWGGYMNAKRQKLNAQYQETVPTELRKENSTGSTIFSGVTIHVNGYTNPSSDELKRLMMLHGGRYEHYLARTRVSHVIATNLPQSKVREIRGLKVVRPEWITESIAAGKLLDFSKYLLYTAQSSGLQKGLKSFSVNNANNTDAKSNQSVHCTSEQNGVSEKDMKTSPPSRTSNAPSIDSGIGSLESIPSVSGSTDQEALFTESLLRRSPETVQKGKEITLNDTTSGHLPAKAGDPKFLNEFYSNSRLHYLSTWKAEFKSYVNELQSKGGQFEGKEELRRVVQHRLSTPEYFSTEGEYSSVRGKKKSRCVMHIDMDCFFVSVGLRKRPDLKGRPVAVTHSKGQGASIDPDSDLNFEVIEYQKRKSRSQKGKAKVSPTHLDNLSFPDISDSDSDDDIHDDVIKNRAPGTESFHSMAEIASCSYEARKAGVKNGMFMGRAKSLCPDLVTIPYDFDGYNEVSRILYDTVASFTHDIEAVSCDELLVDCTDLLADTGARPLEFATLLREKISHSTGCTASAGLGSNILLAKLATKKAKPNGQFHLTDDHIDDHIREQPIGNIPGVGRSMVGRFEAMNVTTCGDLQKHSLDALKQEFGPKTGQALYRYCRGQDDRPIKVEQQRKSVSAEVNYGIRFTSDGEAVKFLQQLSEEVCTRLRNVHMKGKTISLKLMVRRADAPKQTSKFMGHGICNNMCKSVTLPLATDEPRIVSKEVVGLLKLMKAVAEDLRGIGIQIQRLEPATLGPGGRATSILNFTVPKSSESGSTTSGSSNSNNNSANNNSNNSSSGSSNQKTDSCVAGDVSSRNNATNDDTIGDIESSFRSNDVRSKTIKINTIPGVSIHNRTTVTGVSASITNPVYKKDGKQDDTGVTLHRHKSVHTDDNSGDRQIETRSLSTSPDGTRDSQCGSRESGTPGYSRAAHNEDYFPSPSQVDLEVLAELPPEIRQQIEAEMKQRQKTKQTPSKPGADQSVADNSSAGPSHSIGSFQRQSSRKNQNGENITDNRRNDDLGETAPKLNISDRNQVEGGVRRTDSPTSGADDNDSHAADSIVALPSPSQIDPSCLEALPESLQAELRAAYAEQASRAKELSDRGGNPRLQLRQASPTSSPSKRSPGKRSPHFKVPRGRPRGRGNSRKNLFRGRGSTSARETRSSISNFIKSSAKSLQDDPIIIEETSSSIPLTPDRRGILTGEYLPNHSSGVTVDVLCLGRTSSAVNSSDSSREGEFDPCRYNDCENVVKNKFTFNELSKDCEDQNIEPQPSTSKSKDFDDGSAENHPVGDMDSYSCTNTGSKSNVASSWTPAYMSDEVNLCGAVTIADVRSMMQEWLESTVSPQDEDEMVLVNYLNDLILDKNLEQVNLVLKFLFRRVKHLHNKNWLCAAERIFVQTQSLVYNMYGSQLQYGSLT